MEIARSGGKEHIEGSGLELSDQFSEVTPNIGADIQQSPKVLSPAEVYGWAFLCCC